MLESNLNVPIPRRAMDLFFLIDVSGSVDGVKMGIINQAMEETLCDLRNSGSNAEIRASVLTFGSKCEWMYESSVSVEDFRWNRLSDSIGLTPLGTAFDSLCSRMDEEFSKESLHGRYAPAIILLSDCGSTEDYKDALERLRKSRWFMSSTRIVLGVGDNYRRDIALEFAGNSENVLYAGNDRLSDMIRFVSMSTSRRLSDNGRTEPEQNDLEEPESIDSSDDWY